MDVTNTQVNFNCGCGFTTNDGNLAQRHVIEKHHTITVTGLIKPVK